MGSSKYFCALFFLKFAFYIYILGVLIDHQHRVEYDFLTLSYLRVEGGSDPKCLLSNEVQNVIAQNQFNAQSAILFKTIELTYYLSWASFLRSL